MADRLDNFQGHGLVGEEPARPAGGPWRWRTAPEGKQPCLPLVIQPGRTGGMGLGLPVEGSLKALFDQTLADAQHGIDADREALGDPGIWPSRAIRISFQQALGMAYLVGCSCALPGQRSLLFAFLIRKPYDVLFVHGIPRLITPSALRRKYSRLTSKNKADRALGLL
jgi:hypothetical protein